MSLIQGTVLYGAELTWNGQKGVEGENQRAINRMARSVLGAFRLTHLGGRKRTHASQASARTLPGQVHPPTAGETSGRWKPRGDPDTQRGRDSPKAKGGRGY